MIRNVDHIQISHGANLEHRSMLGYSPLHVAAHYGQVDMARILLESGANPDQEDLQVERFINLKVIYRF